VDQKAPLVTFGLHGSTEHLKTCSGLRPVPFGVVGFRKTYVAE